MPTSSKAFPSYAKAMAGKRTLTTTASLFGNDTPDWPLIMAELEERHARALAALEQRHGDHFTRLEERLAAAERATTDLGGQIKEMR